MDIDKVSGPLYKTIAVRVKEAQMISDQTDIVEFCLQLGVDIFYNPSQEMLEAGWEIPPMEKEVFAEKSRKDIARLLPIFLGKLDKDKLN